MENATFLFHAEAVRRSPTGTHSAVEEGVVGQAVTQIHSSSF